MKRLFLAAVILLGIPGCGEQVVVGLLDNPGQPEASSSPSTEFDDTEGNPTSVDDSDADPDRLCAWAPPYETNSAVRGVFGFSAKDVWAVGGDGVAGGLLLHFDGREWQQIVPNPSVIEPSFSANGVWGIDRGEFQDVFVAHDYGVLKAEIDSDGIEWTMELDTSEQLPAPLQSFFDATWKNVYGNSGEEIYAVGGTVNVPLAGGTIAHYSGSKWKNMVGGEQLDFSINSVQDVHGFGSNAPLFAVTAGTMNYGQVLEYTGEGWKVEHSIAPNVFLSDWTGLYGVWGTKPDDLFAVGSRSIGLGFYFRGIILRYTTDDQWSKVPHMASLDYAELRDVWGRSDGSRVFVVGKKRSDGLVLVKDGDGWNQAYYGWEDNEPFDFPLNRVWGDDSGNLFMVGDGGIYYCLKFNVNKGLADQDVSFGY